MKRDWDLLFSEYDLRAVLENALGRALESVSSIPDTQVKNADIEALANQIITEFRAEPIVLREAEITVDSHSAQVDISHDPNRHFSTPGPHFIEGVEVTYYLPFAGDVELFRCRPNQYTMNPPRAVIADNELRFPYDNANHDVAATKPLFEEDLRRVREWIPWVNSQVSAFSPQLESQVRTQLSGRRQKVAGAEEQMDSLGFKRRTVQPTQPTVAVTSPGPSRSGHKASAAGPMPQYDVALSFAGEDRAYVEEVATVLQRAGVSVFYDRFAEVDLWGKNLADHFAKVYASGARFVVMFVSKHYSAKAWPRFERQHAQATALLKPEEYILPARFDDTQLADLPATVKYLDLRMLSPGELAARILQKLGR